MKQLSFFDDYDLKNEDDDPKKAELNEVLRENNLDYEIEDYKLYKNLCNANKYYFVKTKCGKIVELFISYWGFKEREVLFVYKNLNEIIIDNFFQSLKEVPEKVEDCL